MTGVQNIACTKTETRCLILENHIYLAGGREDRLWTLDWTYVSKLDRRHTGQLRKRGNLLTGEGGRGWAWNRNIRYDLKKVWSSINHSVLSGSPSRKGRQICDLWTGTPTVCRFEIRMSPRMCAI
jgi:hypothetical protein